MSSTVDSLCDSAQQKIYKLNDDSISSLELQKITTDQSDIQIDCNKFKFNYDLKNEFQGKNVTINAKKVEIQQTCKLILSGISKNSFNSDAGNDFLGNGRNGKDGCQGQNGGNFTLNCDTITSKNGSILTIESNGADGTNGQDGGSGRDGNNGKDATIKCFTIDKCGFKIHNRVSQEAQRVFNVFKLNEWYDRSTTTQAKITTKEGLAAHIYIQYKDGKNCGFMLVKGGKGKSGRQGGRGGIGGEGGCAGSVNINCDQNCIKIVANPGKDGQNGNYGINGVDGYCGRDLWMYDDVNLDNPLVFGEDYPRKYKLTHGHGEYSVYDSKQQDYVYVEEVQDGFEDFENDLTSGSISDSINQTNEFNESWNEEELIVDKQAHGIIWNLILQPMFDLFENIFVWAKGVYNSLFFNRIENKKNL